jgi:Tfp pilus assembly protein PilF
MAADYFSKSLEVSPEHVDSLHFYGNLLYSQHDDNAAELMYKRAVQVIEAQGVEDPDARHPLFIDTLCNHGALLERVRHDIDGAQALYDKALAFDPQDSSVLFNYGVLLEDGRKDYAAAEAMYRRALEQVPVVPLPAIASTARVLFTRVNHVLQQPLHANAVRLGYDW